MFEGMESIIAIITSAIALITTIYKTCFKTEASRSQAYYKKILVPFVIEYKKKSDIVPTKFLKNIVKRSNDNIPKYIFFLMEQGEDEKLKKVLIYDYFDIYHNEENKMSGIIRMIYRAVAYFIFIISFIILFYSGYFMAVVFYTILFSTYQLISEELNGAIIQSGAGESIFLLAIIAIVMFGMSIFCAVIASELNVDNYTLKEKKIKRLIERRVKTYDKKMRMFVL